MTSGFSLIGLVLSVVYIGLAITIAVFADRLFNSRPIGLWGDLAVASIAVGAFAVFLGDGWHRLLLELNDVYPAYFAVAYLPIVAFVAIGFVRSLVPLIPARITQQGAAMAMAAPGPDTPGTVAFGNNAASAGAPAPETVSAGAPAKPQSRLMKGLQLAVGVVLLSVVVLVGVARFMTRNDLPACNSQTARDILSNIFQSKKVEVKRYDDIKTNGTTEAVVTCTAFMTMMDDHRAEIDYRISFVEDQKVQVQITSARDK
jgi:hypothetical protein